MLDKIVRQYHPIEGWIVPMQKMWCIMDKMIFFWRDKIMNKINITIRLNVDEKVFEFLMNACISFKKSTSYVIANDSLVKIRPNFFNWRLNITNVRINGNENIYYNFIPFINISKDYFKLEDI
jgi:hypothetical protein